MSENKDKPKSCYDCTKSNNCELFEKNCFRKTSTIIVLDKSRLRGCPYDGKTYRG